MKRPRLLWQEDDVCSMHTDVYLILSFVFHNHATLVKHQRIGKRAPDLYDFNDLRQTENGFK